MSKVVIVTIRLGFLQLKHPFQNFDCNMVKNIFGVHTVLRQFNVSFENVVY